MQTEIVNTDALSLASEKASSNTGLQSFHEELQTLRSMRAGDSKTAQPSSNELQIASLQIVDESKDIAAKAETSPDLIKEAVDARSENIPATSSFDNPYTHVSLAAEAMREVQALTGRKVDEKLIITDECGKQEMGVGERLKFLAQVAEKEFTAAISAADRISQTKVEATLFDVRSKLENASEENEKQSFSESETALESLKHSPSATRFAFAMFKAGNGELESAVELLKEAEKRDPEAAKDSKFREFKKELENAITDGRQSIVNKEELMLPLITMSLGDSERQSGNAEKAEQYYLESIKQADALDQKTVSAELVALAEERAKLAVNSPADALAPNELETLKEEKLKELESREMAWAAVAHAPALSRINYADFLLSKGRGDEAHEILTAVQKIDPDLVKDKKEFNEMVALAEKARATADSNPFQHLESFSKALEEQDIDKARSELQAAVSAADSLDRNLARKNKELVLEQLKLEQDEKMREGLTQASEVYDAFEHAAAFTRVVQGRFELAAKNYNQAKALFEEAKHLDPEFVAREEVEIEKLLEAANEPSTFAKILEFTTDLAKELVADASAVVAGAAAVVLTGWTGPGAVVAGAAAGAATYTTIKWLMGDEIHWYTPLWGAIDGATGSIAALARQALVLEGGKLVSKEIAETAVIKVGGDVAAISGLEGLKMAETAQKIASTGLRTMGKDIGLWSRISSSVPFIGTGSAEYRSALAAYRALSYSNFALHAGVNGGTAMAASAVYRGAHEGVNYYNGTHESFGQFARAYGQAVFKDTLTGVVMGGYANSYKDGLALSAAVNGVSTAFSDPKNAVDFLSKFSQKTSTDLAFGSVAWIVGLGGFAADRWLYRGAEPMLQTAFIPSVPLWSEAYYTRESIKTVLGPALEALQTPPAPEEIQDMFLQTPGPASMPAS